MSEPRIRILHQLSDNSLDDNREDFDLGFFGGVVPSAGDVIMNPGVLMGLDRNDPTSREFWRVLYRGFNTKDQEGKYIVLVVETLNDDESKRLIAFT